MTTYLPNALTAKVDSAFSKERQSWLEHKVIKTNAESRFETVQKDSGIALSWYEGMMYGVKYKHFFLTFHPSGSTAEFQGTDHFESLFEIHNKTQMKKYYTETKASFNDEMKERLKKVENMRNYSLLMRNCEHVAKYVIYGRWFSLQVELTAEQNIFQYYFSRASIPVQKVINTMPDGLEAQEVDNLRVQISDNWNLRATCTEAEKTYHERPCSFNVLLLGPTGAGKSNIINHVYKQYIAESKRVASGVTRELHFYPGTFEGPSRKGDICFIDTVGFCDQLMPIEETVRYVFGFLRNQNIQIHKVLVVFGERVRSAELDVLRKYASKFSFSEFEDIISLVLSKCGDMDETEQQKYMNSFHAIHEFNGFGRQLELVSLLHPGQKVYLPRTVCVDLRGIKGRQKEPINYECVADREKLLSTILVFGFQPIVLGSSGPCPECTIL